jgi:hypothetical protein
MTKAYFVAAVSVGSVRNLKLYERYEVVSVEPLITVEVASEAPIGKPEPSTA